MPYIDKSVIDEVKKIDLLTYLKNNEPGELVPIGKDAYCLRSHDSLKISNGLWNWFSKGIGGRSALDYLIKVEGMSFTDAVNRLSGEKPERSYSSISRKEKKTILLPEKHKDNDRVIRYLEEKRGIDPVIVDLFVKRGAIYESEYADKKNGRVFVNAVFLGFDKQGTVRQASIRGIDSDFKGEASGSDKSYSFSLVSERNGEMMHIFESAIDLMSFLTIQKICHHDNHYSHYVSLSGVYHPSHKVEKWRLPLAIERYRTEHPEILRSIIHLDNDAAGTHAANALVASLHAVGIEAECITPHFGKDVNDQLRGIRVRDDCR